MKKLFIIPLIYFILFSFYNNVNAYYKISPYKVNDFFTKLYNKKPQVYKEVIKEKKDIVVKIANGLSRVSTIQFVNDYVYKNKIRITNNEIIINNYAFNDLMLRDYIKTDLRDKIFNRLIDSKKLRLSDKSLDNISIVFDRKSQKVNIDFIDKNKKKDKDDIDILIDKIIKENYKNDFYEKISNIRYNNTYYKFLSAKDKEKQFIYIKYNLDDLINIYLSPDDLYKHFELDSYRTRFAGNEALYRQQNIQEWYKTLSPDGLKILNPGEDINFHEVAIQGDDGVSKYKNGLAIVDKKVEKIYGGGLCGAATGLYQGVLYNKDISVTGRNHSIYSWMYNSTMQGKDNRIPGLDKTYYGEYVNVITKNVSDYPIILYNSLDLRGFETNFTLGIKGRNNLSTVTYLGQYEYNKFQCYKWKINGKIQTSCYKTKKQLEKEAAVADLEKDLKNKKITKEEYTEKMKEIEKEFE